MGADSFGAVLCLLIHFSPFLPFILSFCSATPLCVLFYRHCKVQHQSRRSGAAGCWPPVNLLFHLPTQQGPYAGSEGCGGVLAVPGSSQPCPSGCLGYASRKILLPASTGC